jgi:branched-chain amino acid transport system permease protein
MASLAIALLDGLSYASMLFLMASGLTLIFGVTRMLIWQVHSFGVLLFPQATLVLVFVTMGLVLTIRLQGLLCRALAPLRQERGRRFVLWPVAVGRFQLLNLLLAVAVGASLGGGQLLAVTGL